MPQAWGKRKRNEDLAVVPVSEFCHVQHTLPPISVDEALRKEFVNSFFAGKG